MPVSRQYHIAVRKKSLFHPIQLMLQDDLNQPQEICHKCNELMPLDQLQKHTLRNEVFETHQIWCAFTVPPGTPDIVFMAHLEKCVYHTI